jgi:uncharacterized protein
MTNSYLLTTQGMSKSLRSLVKIIQKTQNWSAQNNVSENSILDAKLAPDMYAFVKQIQLVSDNAKGTASRLSGVEIPSYADEETSLDQLADRLNRTIEFVDAIPSESFDQAEDKKITLPFMPGKYLTADEYVRAYAIPNFYFHLVTAYAILRNLGVSLGKMDYINEINLLDL